MFHSFVVSIKLKEPVLKSFLDKFIVAVLVRFTVSILGALALYIFLKCNFINGLDRDTNPFIVYGLALVAGFSENLIPSLMTKFETNLVKGETMRVVEPTRPNTATGNPAPAAQTVTQPQLQEATIAPYDNMALDGSDEEGAVG